MKEYPLIIDLSHHNETGPLVQVMAETDAVGFIFKATQGTGYVDPMYESRRAEAEQYDIPFGSYHFLEHGNVAAQMDHFLKTVMPQNGERVVLDYESYEDETPDLGDLHAAIEYLRDAEPTLQITIYGGGMLKEQLGDKFDGALAPCALWIAQYSGVDAPTWPTGTWHVWTLWQFTDAYLGHYDASRFNGSHENAILWLRPAVTP